MTIDEIVKIADMAGKDKPLGVKFLDDLFDLETTTIYYRFMYYLVQRMKPELVVELGVYTGRSTAHLAAASASGLVIGIDPNPNDISNILCMYKNIDLRIGTSTSPEILDSIKNGSVDLCFVDTVHTYEQIAMECAVWIPKMKAGGVVLFDDISLDESMVRAWSFIQSKYPTGISLPHLHHSGFGAIIV